MAWFRVDLNVDVDVTRSQVTAEGPLLAFKIGARALLVQADTEPVPVVTGVVTPLTDEQAAALGGV